MRERETSDWVKYESGGFYKGEWLKGTAMLEGKGRMICNDGIEFEGYWNAGNFIHGRTLYTAGGIYEGDCLNNLKTGKGTLLLGLSGDKYEGFWSKGKKNGSGTMYYAKSGDICHGNWVQDKLEGEAVYVTA